jgi:hypothetical protein
MDVPMDIGKVQAFLSQLGQSAGVAQTAADNGPAIGAYLLNYILGSSPTSSDGLDGILATLMSTWSGDGADAFKAQARTVRAFGIGVAALADKTVNTQPTGSQIPVQMQYELGSMADYTGAAGTLSQLFADTHGKYTAATSDFPNWAQYLAGVMRDTSDNIRNNTLWSTNTTVTVHVPTFAEFVAGKRGPGGVTGVLKVDFSNSDGFDPGTSKVSYYNPEYGSGFDMTIGWPFWKPDEGSLDSKNQAAIQKYTQESEYDNFLLSLMDDLGGQYPQVQAPQPQDNSVLPKTNGAASTQPNPGGYDGGYPGGAGGLGAGTTLGGATNGNVPGYGSGSANGSYSPGSYGGDGYVPAGSNGGAVPGGYGGDGYVPGAYNAGPSAGGWNPTRLAGYNPNAGGLGPGASGFADGGPGALGGGGAGGAFPGGAGAGGADGLGAAGGLPGAQAGVAGAAGAASRGMPMAPMSGMGGGKDGKERQRAAWLAEDEDVWGAADDGGDAVL